MVSKEDLERIAETFVDHHTAKGTLYKDWTAAFRNWVRRDLGLGWGAKRIITGNGHGNGRAVVPTIKGNRTGVIVVEEVD